VGEPFVVAVDVGGTTIKGARVGRDGAVHDQHVVPTPVGTGPDAVVTALRQLVRSLADTDATGVGVVVPGAVDVEGGIARYAANLGWRDVPLVRLLRADTRLPVAIDHDARGAGLAESAYGARLDDFLLVIMGTGVSGAIVRQGRPLAGALGLAGEFGHAPVYPGGEPCACGQRGCLEVYASGSGVARRYSARKGETLPAAEIGARLAVDDVAAAVWQEAVDALALALASATLLVDPGAIVLGGGLAGAGSALRDPLVTALKAHLRWRPPPPVETSPIADRLGLLGAARLAWGVAEPG
jgi:glucokinase